MTLSAACCATAASGPIPVKVVVVTMFERGADTGDEPGEFQYWVERNKLDRVVSFPQGYHDLRMNRGGVLGILTGIGTAKAAASILRITALLNFESLQPVVVLTGGWETFSGPRTILKSPPVVNSRGHNTWVQESASKRANVVS